MPAKGIPGPRFAVWRLAHPTSLRPVVTVLARIEPRKNDLLKEANAHLRSTRGVVPGCCYTSTMTRAVLAVLLSVVACNGALEGPAVRDDASRVVPDSSATTADASKYSGMKTDASTSSTSTVGEPDGALIWSGPLPACHWPSNILPPVPDGGLALGSISRAVLFCGGIPFDGGMSGSEWCGSDNGVGCSVPDGGGYVVSGPGSNVPLQDEPCVMACEATQYAVLTADPFDFGPGSPSMDADIIDPRPPAGCTGVLPAFMTVTTLNGSAEEPPSVQCCPCE
jgi:hypothetical protein